MTTNFIVPCGISQIKNYGENSPLTGWIDYYRSLTGNDEIIAQEAFDSEETTRYRDDILSKIQGAKDGNGNKILGAELYTMAALAPRRGNRWMPANDRIVLLRTDTPAGRLSAEIVRDALRDIWGVPEDDSHLVIRRVSSWKPDLNAAEADVALGNLADLMNGELRYQPFTNILVATGGLRSTMPCLTIYSLLFGFEMIYMSEESTEPMELKPSNATLDVPWKKILAHDGRGGNKFKSYVNTAISFREKPNHRF